MLLLFFFSVQYAMFVYRFFKEWRKIPRWSFSCCLALLLPLNDLQQEVLGMTGKNELTQQLQTGNVDLPPLSGALKESGDVSIELTIFPEHPEETSGSSLQETETCPKIEGNADKGVPSTREEPEKQAMTGKSKVKQPLQTDNVNMLSPSGALKKSGAMRAADKVAFEKEEKPEQNRLPQDNLQQEIREMGSRNPLKQQLQAGNVNTPSKSGALKKSGAMRIVHASIHEHPKKKRRSLTKEKKAIEKKERIAGKLPLGKEEEREKYSPPQENLQQDVREMRSRIPLKQQLQTGNVNTPSESEVLKQSGAIDFVLVTVHEHPNEACGSPSEERGSGELKQGDDKQVATNTPEEGLEETRL